MNNTRKKFVTNTMISVAIAFFSPIILISFLPPDESHPLNAAGTIFGFGILEIIVFGYCAFIYTGKYMEYVKICDNGFSHVTLVPTYNFGLILATLLLLTPNLLALTMQSSAYLFLGVLMLLALVASAFMVNKLLEQSKQITE